MHRFRNASRIWNYGNDIIINRLYTTRLSPKIVEQIARKNAETVNIRREPIVIVLPQKILAQTIDFASHHELTFDQSPAPSTVENDTAAGKSTKVSKKQQKAVELPWQITSTVELSKLGQHYLMLSKIRLTTLVVITSMAGYAMAPAPFELSTFVLCSLGTGLCSAAANSINQYHEVPYDAQMSRTKNRVLVRGLLTPLHAIGFAAGSSALGIGMLYYGVNGFTAVLGMANLVLYTSIYTPMKRISIANTWVGSIVGAIPPLMGWVGCSGTIDAGGWILAGLLYAWQFPHFNALSWNLRPDYSRAGYRMMSVTNPQLCRSTSLRYTVGLTVLSMAAPALEVTNYWFALGSLPLNAYFTYLAWKFYQHSDSGSSRKLFRFSLLHLPALMIMFLLTKKHWICAEEGVTSTAVASAAIVASEEISEKQMAIASSTASKTNQASSSDIVNVAAPFNQSTL